MKKFTMLVEWASIEIEKGVWKCSYCGEDICVFDVHIMKGKWLCPDGDWRYFGICPTLLTENIVERTK